MTTKQPVRVAIYTRKSLEDDDMQKYSHGAQEDSITAFSHAQYDRWVLVDKYVDSATGTNLDRPAVQRLLADARAHRFDVIIVYRIDRLSRNVRQLAAIVDEMISIGVVLRSATEPFDTASIAGKMMLQMLGVFAEFEHSTIIERTKAGMRRKAKKGEWCGGRLPFGYKIEPEKGIVPDDAQAQVVRETFRLYSVERLGSVNVAKKLNELGWRRANGGRWHNKAVIELIRRPVYAGKIKWGGVEQDGIHEALIDTETFTRAGEILAARGEDSTLRLSNRSDFLLTGNIHCAACGGRMIGVSGNKDGVKHCYYACRTRNRLGADQCGQEYVPAHELEDAIIERVKSVIGSREVFDQVVAAAKARMTDQRPAAEEQMKAIDAQLQKSRTALDRYFAAFESGAMDAPECSQRIQALTGDVRALERQREELAQRATEVGTTPDASLAEFMARFDEGMKKGAPPSQKKHLVKLLVPRVEVASRSEIDVYFRAPPSLVRLTSTLAPHTGHPANHAGLLLRLTVAWERGALLGRAPASPPRSPREPGAPARARAQAWAARMAAEGITPAELSRALGVSRAYVSQTMRWLRPQAAA